MNSYEFTCIHTREMNLLLWHFVRSPGHFGENYGNHTKRQSTNSLKQGVDSR